MTKKKYIKVVAFDEPNVEGLIGFHFALIDGEKKCDVYENKDLESKMDRLFGPVKFRNSTVIDIQELKKHRCSLNMPTPEPRKRQDCLTHGKEWVKDLIQVRVENKKKQKYLLDHIEDVMQAIDDSEAIAQVLDAMITAEVRECARGV